MLGLVLLMCEWTCGRPAPQAWQGTGILGILLSCLLCDNQLETEDYEGCEITFTQAGDYEITFTQLSHEL